jgi:hypothetical protein
VECPTIGDEWRRNRCASHVKRLANQWLGAEELRIYCGDAVSLRCAHNGSTNRSLQHRGNGLGIPQPRM